MGLSSLAGNQKTIAVFCKGFAKARPLRSEAEAAK
jgi:hypothetical protein